MENPVIKLNNLATQKRKACADLFNAQILQTELEVDLTLIKLDFRYDEESDWLQYGKNLEVYNELLKKLM
jgi:hypothetical protein